jgi:hypothetical protein
MYFIIRAVRHNFLLWRLWAGQPSLAVSWRAVCVHGACTALFWLLSRRPPKKTQDPWHVANALLILEHLAVVSSDTIGCKARSRS